MYDVVIIGGGVTGCAVARELSRYQGKMILLEKASDICEGTSKANSGIVHAGHDAKPGSLKAHFNVLGSQKMEALSKELDFSYRKNGSIVLCFHEEERGKLEKLLSQGIQNGVTGLEILEAEAARKLEQNLSDDVVAVLNVPDGGIVCPFGLTIALAENAAENGVEFRLGTEVTGIRKSEDGYVVYTNQGEFESRVIVNAAGVYADTIHNMLTTSMQVDNAMEITPRKGEYCLLDKKVGNYVSHTLFQLPNEAGKGVLVTPTVHGNLLVGPTSDFIQDKDNISTTAAGLASVAGRGGESVRSLPMRQVITSFSGLRARCTKRPVLSKAAWNSALEGDFVIGEVSGAEGFIDVAGIESPGLTAAPAIGEYVAGLVQVILHMEKNPSFHPKRNGIPCMATATIEEQKSLIRKNAAYANVVCRCEMVTEGEILDAIHRPLGATTLDGVKRRTRAGMGRCQAGFCSPRTVEILARELHVQPEDITKAGGNSQFLTGINKEALTVEINQEMKTTKAKHHERIQTDSIKEVQRV